MPEYRVYLRATGDIDVEVEADNRDFAIDAALEIVHANREPDWEWYDIEEIK